MRRVGIPIGPVHYFNPSVEFRLIIRVPPESVVPELLECRPCASYVARKTSHAVDDIRELRSLIMKPELRCADIPIRGKDWQGYGRNECRDPEHARRVSESCGQRLGTFRR